jgi:hypothetical protein
VRKMFLDITKKVGDPTAVSSVTVTIIHAAVYSPDKAHLFIGKSHAECLHQASKMKVKMNTAPASHQGFVTNFGDFVSREEAAKIAYQAGQIDRKLKILFSEDLWSPVDGGKYDYDEARGYVLRSEAKNEN